MLSASGPPPNNPPKPKHVNCKCSHQNCDNCAVQGGVYITHGARRKCCAHPGCDKAVKLSRYCSAHGPSRRKCDRVRSYKLTLIGIEVTPVSCSFTMFQFDNT